MLVAIVAALGSAPAFAGGTPYNLRTEPATPIAGQPFDVVIEPIPCGSYYSTDPTGQFPQYGGVTVAASVIVARFVYSSIILCTEPPVTVRQRAPALPAGNYTIQLVLQAFPPPPNEDLLETVAIVVVPAGTGAGAVQIRSVGVWSLLGLALLLAGVGVLSSRRRQAGKYHASWHGGRDSRRARRSVADRWESPTSPVATDGRGRGPQ